MQLRVLLRLSHLYESGESALAVPVEVDLSKVFAEAGLKITGATETTLTANAPYDASKLECGLNYVLSFFLFVV